MVVQWHCSFLVYFLFVFVVVLVLFSTYKLYISTGRKYKIKIVSVLCVYVATTVMQLHINQDLGPLEQN
jgi:beta-lactam-binding protein with PASTA domain